MSVSKKVERPTRIGSSVVASAGSYKRWLLSGLLVAQVPLLVAAFIYAVLDRDYVVGAIFVVDAGLVWYVFSLLIVGTNSPTVAIVEDSQIKFFRTEHKMVVIPRDDVDQIKISMIRIDKRPRVRVSRFSGKDFTDDASLGLGRPRLYLALRRRGYRVHLALADTVHIMHSPAG
jgi:hypothetical protein